MAGKIRHLLYRSRRYYARLSVPASLRLIIGKRELIEALGADTRKAERNLPSVIAGMQNQLDAARMEALKGSKPAARRSGKLLSEKALALAHYESETSIDRDERFASHIPEGQLNKFSAQPHLSALKRVVSGEADVEETQSVIGWAIDAFAKNGNTAATQGGEEWTQLARTLAATQIEAVKRSLERDRGNYEGKPLIIRPMLCVSYVAIQ